MSNYRTKRIIAALAAIIVFVLAGVKVLQQRHQKPEYIFVMGVNGSLTEDSMVESFCTEVEKLGGTAKVLENDRQRTSLFQAGNCTLNEYVSSNTACIIVNASSNYDMAEQLQKYREKGIAVISCISELDAEYRQLHIGTVNPETSGSEMFRTTVERCGGTGKFAIAGGSPYSVFLNSMLTQIRRIYQNREYPDMILSDIFYGYEDIGEGKRQILEFFKEVPDCKALLCLSERMTESACMAVKEAGLESEISIVGLGNPQYLESYLSDSRLNLDLFYCDMDLFGRLIAQTVWKISEGEIQGKENEIIEIGGIEYRIQEDTPKSEDDTKGSELYYFEEYQTYHNEESVKGKDNY